MASSETGQRPDGERLKARFFELLDLDEDARERAFAAEQDDPALRRELRAMFALCDDATTHAIDRPAPLPQEIDRPPFAAADRIDDRYELESELGHSGGGSVWRARDTLHGATVALKFLPPHANEALALEEGAALRFLRLGGIVDLIDEGQLDGGTRYHVTRWVDGAAFPGMRAPAAWSALEGLVAQVLRTLCALHERGITHGDIKPANVLVTTRQTVTILDLGAVRASTGQALEEDSVAMTLAWAAPELLAGRSCAFASDWWSVGVMVHEAMTGQRFRTCSSDQVFSAAERDRVPSFAEDADPAFTGLDARVRRLLQDMVALDPDLRAPAARELLSALDLRTNPATRRVQRDVRSAQDLEELFCGPRRIHFLPQDAARELWLRNGRDDTSRARVLRTWVERGFAEVDGDRLLVRREALDRLWLERIMGRAEHLDLSRALRAGDADAIAQATANMAHEFSDRGRLGPAFAIMREGLAALRHRGQAGEAATRCAADLLGLALSSSTVRSLELCHWELRRLCAKGHPAHAKLERIAQAALWSLTGKRGEALELCRRLEMPSDATSQLVMWRVRLYSARFDGSEDFDAEIRAFAQACSREEPSEAPRETSPYGASPQEKSPRGASASMHWGERGRYLEQRNRAFAAFHAGRYSEAAALHLATGTLDGISRREAFAARIAAAQCYLEEFELASAARTSELLLREAQDYRDSMLQADAEYLKRAARYRNADFVEVDRDLVQAARFSAPSILDALILLGEAAFAWRRGDLAEARQLAGDSAVRFAALRRPEELLPRALAVVCGSKTIDVFEDLSRLETTLERMSPGVAVQICALLARSRLPVADAMHLAARKYRAQCPDIPPDRPAEVLSLDEASRR